MLCIRHHLTGEWLLRTSARRLFLLASLGALGFMLIRFFAPLLLKDQSAVSPFTSAVFLTLIAVGAISSAAIYFGMLYYWFVHDRGQRRGRTWWCFFLFLSPFFAVLYYFAAYRPDISTRPPLQNASPI